MADAEVDAVDFELEEDDLMDDDTRWMMEMQTLFPLLRPN
jgi:hypothetical protein